MSLHKNSHFVVLGGIPHDLNGRALGPYRIRTVLENYGYTTSIVDYFDELSPQELEKIISFVAGDNTIGIGFSYTWEINSWKIPAKLVLLEKILHNIKKIYPNVSIIIGAVNAQRMPLEMFSLCDWIMNGYSELSLPALLLHLQKKSDSLKYYKITRNGHTVGYINGDKDYIIDNNDLLFTRFQKEDKFESYQPITIELSRGCVFNCSYCHFAFKNKKIYDYIRSAENIAEELRRNYELFGTTRYMLADDTFNDSMEKINTLRRAVDMAKLPNFEYSCYIRPELLVTKPQMMQALIDSGIRGAHFGIESLNNDTRKLIGRPISIEKIIDMTEQWKSMENKIRINGTFIIGLPGDSIDDIEKCQQTLIKIRENFLDRWIYSPLMIMRGNLGITVNFQDDFTSLSYQSPFEKTPEKFGYDVTNNYDSIFVNWSNNYMNYEQALSMALDYNRTSTIYHKLAGWQIATGWYYGLSDHDIYNLNYNSAEKKFIPSVSRKKYWLDTIE